MQKLLTFFQQKDTGIFQILTFEILTKLSLTPLLVLNKHAQILRNLIQANMSLGISLYQNIEFISQRSIYWQYF